jgi:hypothetical protein
MMPITAGRSWKASPLPRSGSTLGVAAERLDADSPHPSHRHHPSVPESRDSRAFEGGGAMRTQGLLG